MCDKLYSQMYITVLPGLGGTSPKVESTMPESSIRYINIQAYGREKFYCLKFYCLTGPR